MTIYGDVDFIAKTTEITRIRDSKTNSNIPNKVFLRRFYDS